MVIIFIIIIIILMVSSSICIRGNVCSLGVVTLVAKMVVSGRVFAGMVVARGMVARVVGGWLKSNGLAIERRIDGWMDRL